MNKFNIVFFIIFGLFTPSSFAESLEKDVVVEKPYLKYVKEWPKTDFSQSSIDFERIIDGGPEKDGIPSIDDPIFKAVGKIDNIHPDEPVIAVHYNGMAKAYPLRVLLWHEIVNDKIDDLPIAVTYCPLCNASVVFDRRIDGEEVEFGVTGKLYKSDMLMYDRKSESWWQQYTGEAVIGNMLGKKLNKVVSRVESLLIFKSRHPDGKVLVPKEYIRSYGASPYSGYDSSRIPFLYDGEYKGKLKPMEYLVVVGDEAWPLEFVKFRGKITHNDLVILWTPSQFSVLDNFNIRLSRDIGNIVVIRKIDEGVYSDTEYGVVFAFVYDAFHPDGVIHYGTN